MLIVEWGCSRMAGGRKLVGLWVEGVVPGSSTYSTSKVLPYSKTHCIKNPSNCVCAVLTLQQNHIYLYSHETASAIFTRYVCL